MNCHEVDELASLYVLGGLTAEEHAALIEHLRGCNQHADTIARLQTVVMALPLTVEELEPPARLKSAIMANVRQVRSAPLVRLPQRVAWPALRLRLPQLAYAAALLLIVGLLAWNLDLQLAHKHTSQAVFARNLTNGAGGTGELLYIEGPDVGVLSVDGLQALPADQAYQLWSMSGNQLESRGVLSAIQPGHGIQVVNGDIAQAGPVFITIEPLGGSEHPSGLPVLFAQH